MKGNVAEGNSNGSILQSKMQSKTRLMGREVEYISSEIQQVYHRMIANAENLQATMSCPLISHLGFAYKFCRNRYAPLMIPNKGETAPECFCDFATMK